MLVITQASKLPAVVLVNRLDYVVDLLSWMVMARTYPPTS